MKKQFINSIAGYCIREHLHESANSLVYRGYRESDGHPVILKILKDPFPSPEQIAWFRHEYEITCNLNLPGVVRAYALEMCQQQWLMVLEDFGGQSLAQLDLAGIVSLTEVLHLAIHVTEILGQIHQQHVIHKDINPSNIVYNPATGQVKLIDFGIATVLSCETPVFRSPHVLEGTLAYISPEQTGRMNRLLDYRTDFYSLGVTLYELLTGQMPFVSSDILELVHSHIARQPRPPHELKPAIPVALSAIILKLMAKNAEDRYQSAYGLKADLEECLQQWQQRGRIEPFLPGQYDLSDRLTMPQKLYGRQGEVAALLDSFARVSDGSCELVLVAGAAGIGKSALVQEIHRPITRQRGYFISGKFDQFQHDIPYSALIQALQSLMRQILTESEARLASWRERLLAAFGPNGRVITEIIPEVEIIVGPQPELAELSPTEAQNRFMLVFQRFIQVFTRIEHPLVLFVDDLQWADHASLTLLKRLLTMTSSAEDYAHALLVIGTYRDNEIGAGHPLLLTVQAFRQAAVAVHEVQLRPLDTAAVNQFVADALHQDSGNMLALADLLIAKTDGNPFFLAEFLKTLHSAGLLLFNQALRQWQWDLDQIQAQQMTDNVAELMTARVQQLAEPTRALLALAACMGNRFDLATLAIVAGQPPVQTARILEEALTAGLVVPLSQAYKLMTFDVPGLAAHVAVDYAFAHDRIQQAVYALLSSAEQQTVHWRIGRLLLARVLRQADAPLMQSDGCGPGEAQNDLPIGWAGNGLPDEVSAALEERIFDIVSHLNQGRACSTTQAERDSLAALNLIAGKRARAAAAYEPAFNYLLVGIEMLGSEGWQRQYHLALELSTQGAAAAYLSGDAAAMERLTSAVLEQARSLLDSIPVYDMTIQALAARHQFLEAIQVTLPVLQSLGIDLPLQPTQEDTVQRMQAIQQMLADMSSEQVCVLPPMADPHMLAAIRLLSSLFSVSYIGAPALMPLIVFEQVRLSLTHGNAAPSPFAYANYGLMLCGMLGDIAAGARAGALALRLLERLDARAFQAKTLVTVNFFITHWTQHARETLDSLREGYRSGLETGDFEYAAYAAYMHTCHAFLIGGELEALLSEFEANNATLAQLQQERTRQQNGLYWQVAFNLREQVEEPCRISGDYYDEAQALVRLQEANDVPSLANISFTKLLLCYLFQHDEQAVDYATQTEHYLAGLTGSLFMPLFHFYDSLARLNTATRQQADDATLERVAASQQKLWQWAQFAPMNNLHKWYLVAAEQARVLGRPGDAREYYDQAIALAQEHRYLNEEAIACELAGRFYLARGQQDIARLYLYKAHYAYLRWGALALARRMEKQYAHLAPQAAPSPSQDPRITRRITITDPTGQGTVQALDFASVVKASQAISGEIVLETLLARLMHTVIENAGAERGLLLLDKGGRWVVEAEGHIDWDDVTVLQSLPLAAASVPPTVINYVARTRENIVLADAAEEGQFTEDAYIQAHQPRSILCSPLIHQGNLMGMLYLENNQTTGAFTSDRLEVLSMLSGQVAISIENATLYAHLEDLVEERTDALRTAYKTVKALNERLQSELNLAHNIQQSLLPPARPGWPALDVVCYTAPAREVGGDLYTYHVASDQRYVVAVGDISGKGMPAALLMAVSMALFRSMVGQGLAPAAFLAALDAALTDYTSTTHQNCALVYLDMMMEPAGGCVLRAANAGCVIPIVKHVGGDVVWVDIGGLPLGVGVGVDLGYQEAVLHLAAGDMAILTSDGVIEAMNADEEMFGFERLEQAVADGPHTSAEAMLAHLRLSVERFVGITEPHDDLTIVVIQV